MIRCHLSRLKQVILAAQDKAWFYLFVAHDEINESRQLKGFERFVIK